MKFFTLSNFVILTFTSLLLNFSKCSATSKYPGQSQCPIPSSTKSISDYFDEMNYWLKLLSVFEPYSDARPANATFERSAKRLMKLGNSIDKATQRLEMFNGILDEKTVYKIDHSLQLSAQYVINITALVDYGKELSDKYNYTTANVQIIQGITSQYSLLFKQLIFHLPPTSYDSIGYSMSTIICALTNSMDYLQPGAYTDQGREFCKALKTTNGGGNSFDHQSIGNINKTPKCFTDCNNSATAMFKYGMNSGQLGKNQTSSWCSQENGTKDPCEYHPSCAFTYNQSS